MKELFFKIKYGYSQSDQVSIPESELEKAIFAQISGKPIRLKNSYINGRNIISIAPHFHKYTGWHDFYEPKDGEDWEQIKRDCPNFDGVLEAYTERVKYLLETKQENKIGTMPLIEIKQIEKSKRSGGMKSIGNLLTK